MKYSILTPFQYKVLTQLYEHGFAERGYFLTGGTALAEFYFQHRYSDDLDFFTRHTNDFKADIHWILEKMDDFGLQVEIFIRSDRFLNFHVFENDKNCEPLKIDMVHDINVMMDAPQQFGTILVDSLEDIAVNKTCMIISRYPTEPKDMIDLYFILNESLFDLDHLMKKAVQKDVAFEDKSTLLMFANRLIEFQTFDFYDKTGPIPMMKRNIRFNKMQDFFKVIGKDLIRKHKPKGEWL